MIGVEISHQSFINIIRVLYNMNISKNNIKNERKQIRSVVPKSTKLESDTYLYFSEWSRDNNETVTFITAKIADTNLLNKTYLNLPNHHVIYL